MEEKEKKPNYNRDSKVLRTYTSDMADAVRTNEVSVIKIALAEKEKRGKIKQKVKLIQNIRGESDVAVAAASIIARTEFLRTLKQLSMEVGYSLPKGATHVEEAARELVKKYDESVLNFTAKKHFKTTKRVLGK